MALMTHHCDQSTRFFLPFQELAVSVTEDFIEYLTEGAVAIEVYGHRQADAGRNPALWDLSIIQAKTRTLRDR